MQHYSQMFAEVCLKFMDPSSIVYSHTNYIHLLIWLLFDLQISLWLPAIAFSLCYGTINAKMWRVYLICQKPKPSMKKVTVSPSNTIV